MSTWVGLVYFITWIKINASYLSFELQYLTYIIETKSISGKISGNSGMVLFAEINQAPSLYSMLQHIGRVATLELVLRNCLRYLEKTLIMGGGGLASKFM